MKRKKTQLFAELSHVVQELAEDPKMGGRRLNAPKKGINIINGKKYICK